MRVIYYKVPENIIGGPYAVALLRSDGSHTGTCVRGIQTIERAKERAWQYGQSYGTTDITEVKI